MNFLRGNSLAVLLLALTLTCFSLANAQVTSPPKPFKIAYIIAYILFNEDFIAADDNLNIASGTINNSLNVLDNDTLPPTATLVSIGGPAEANAGDQATGVSFATAAGAQVTLAANGQLTYDATGLAAATTGVDTLFYTVQRGTETKIAEVTINFGEAPTSQDGPSFNVLFSDTLTIPNTGGLLSNDALGTPDATLTRFGSGSLGGLVTDNASGTAVAIADGLLTVNADGSLELVSPPLIPGTINWSYRLENAFGFSDANAQITITAPPTAQDDTLSAKVNISNSYPASTLFNDNGNNEDDLGIPNDGDPAATITGFGNFNNGSGDAGEFAFGTTQAIPAPINGTLTVNADGSLSIENPTAAGSFTFQYTLDNGVDTASVATVTVNVVPAPIAQNDSYTFLVDVDQTFNVLNGLFVDNGSGSDFLGTPTSTVTSFGGGSLGGTVTSNTTGSTVISAAIGGSLTVNSDGSFSLTGQPFNVGTFTFDYRLTNVHGTSDAKVTLIIQDLPVANNDAFTFDLGSNQTTPNTLFLNNGNGADNLGVPAATVTSFGGGSLGGAITDNTSGSSVSLAGGTLTVNANGIWTLTGQPFTPGTYTFDYRLTNINATSDATVTLTITQLPVANDDSYELQALVNANFNAAAGVFIDNGSGADILGSPNSTLTSFGGGDLGGTVTSNAASDTVTFTAAGGNLTVNADGSFSLTGQPFNEGTFTFDYRLTNSAGTSDGTVSLVISNLPVAQDDDFTFSNTSNQTTPNGLFLDNGNGADTVSGATIASFGGGSLGGAVTDNAAGNSVALAGGSLTINANGTWSLTGQPFTGGTFTVDYRLTNAGGSSDATITLNITAPPVLTNDSPAAASVPGNDFHSALNTANNVANDDSDDLDQNDNLGNPAGMIDRFGAIQFNNGTGTFGAANGTVTDYLEGVTLNLGSLGVLGISDGSLTVNANGSYSFVPPSNYTGLFGFQYRVTNTQGSDTATVLLAVGNRPQCVADSSYTSSVNIPIAVTDGANDVLANDNGDALSVFTVQGNAANVGNTVAGNTNGSSSSTNRVQMNANGSFNHSPAAGVAGANTFNYNVANGFGVGTTPCAVTVTTSLVSGTAAWFIDQSATGSNNFGTFDDPFTSIASFNTQNAAGSNQPTVNDRIYIDPNGTYNEADGINLLNNQHLSGGTVQFNTAYAAVAGGGAALDSSYSNFAGTAEGTRTAIAATAGDGIDLADANTVSGFNIGNTPAGFGLDGTAIGSPTINNVDINGTGGALRIGTSANLNNVTLGQVSSSSSVAENIRLVGATGALTLGSGGTGLSGSASGSNAIIVSGGSVSFTYADPISKTNAGRVALVEAMTGGTKTLSGTLSSSGTATGILVQNNTGGTTNFSGAVKTINTGSNDAVTLQNNAGSTTNFSGGGLDIDTTTGRGFRAATSGTVTVTGANNSVTTGTGTAVDIFNTTIGAAGVTLRSVSSNGGTVGIGLNNTGTVGGFTITGDGTGVRNGSGGTIQNKTQDGIFLTNTRNVTIRQLNLTDNATEGDVNFGDDHAIDINTVTNFIYEDAVINGFGNSILSHDDQHSIAIMNLYGTSTIDNVVFDDINENAVEYINTNTDDASQDVLTISNSTFNDHLSANGESAVEAQAQGTSNMGLVVSSSTFNVNGNGTLGVSFQGLSNSTSSLTVQNSTFNSNSTLGSGSIATNNLNTSNSTILITGNMINGTPFTGIDVINNDDATTNATISNNTVDGNGVFTNNGFGIRVQQDENGTVNALVDNNSTNDFTASHLRVIGRDTTDGTGTINVTVTNNTSTNAPADFTFGAEVLAQDNNTVCVDFRGNNFIGNDGGFPGFGDDIRFNRSGTATLNVEQTSAANVTALNNSDTVSVGGVVTFGAANCLQP